MAHRWLLARLYGTAGPDPALPAVLPRLARQVRSADPGACFWFSRDASQAGPSVSVWLSSGPEAADAATRTLLSQERAPWRVAIERDLTRPVRNPHESDRDVTDELAAVSSEFALAALPGGGAPGEEEAFSLAVAHLSGVAGLLPGAARQGFLFQCWTSWSAGLPARRREELAVEADVRASAGHGAGEPLQDYLDRTLRAIRRQRPGQGLPEPYLLFHQAGATHRRLGVPPAWGAAAALAVRNASAGRGVPVASTGGRI